MLNNNFEQGGNRSGSTGGNIDPGWGSMSSPDATGGNNEQEKKGQSMLERYHANIKEETKAKIRAINEENLERGRRRPDPAESSEYRGWAQKSMLEGLGARVNDETKAKIRAINEAYDERVKATQNRAPVFNGSTLTDGNEKPQAGAALAHDDADVPERTDAGDISVDELRDKIVGYGNEDVVDDTTGDRETNTDDVETDTTSGDTQGDHPTDDAGADTTSGDTQGDHPTNDAGTDTTSGNTQRDHPTDDAGTDTTSGDTQGDQSETQETGQNQDGGANGRDQDTKVNSAEASAVEQLRELRDELTRNLERINEIIEETEQEEDGNTDSTDNGEIGSGTNEAVSDEEHVDDASSERSGTLSERVRARIEKAKNSPGFKNFTKKFVPLAVIGSLVLGGIASNATFANQQKQPENTSNGPQVESKYDYDGSFSIDENQEVRHGIYDGYNETGMFMSAHKGTAYDFANAKEVAGVVGEDECDIMKEVDHNQVETLADHLANVPDSVKAKYGVSSEFMGLSILDTEAKLQSLSDDDFDSLTRQVDQIWDDAFTRSVTLDGEYQNAYMRLIDPSKPATHDNIELVECTTQENGTSATEFFWTVDGNGNSDQLGKMVVKISDNFDGCIQAVNQFGSNPQLYSGMTSVARSAENPGAPFIPVSETTPTITPNNPTTTPNNPSTPDEPDERIQPKDRENLERIDQNINRDIADNIGTGEIGIEPTPEVSPDDITEQPSSDVYEGTGPRVVPNDSAENAEQVQDQVGEQNNYATYRGGANQNQFAPVEENRSAQEAADANGSTGADNADDILNDLGIN